MAHALLGMRYPNIITLCYSPENLYKPHEKVCPEQVLDEKLKALGHELQSINSKEGAITKANKIFDFISCAMEKK